MMHTIRNSNKEALLKAVAGCKEGNKSLLKALGIPQRTIQNIHQILNNYSSNYPALLLEIITHSITLHAPDKALLRCERFVETDREIFGIPLYSPELPYLLATIFSTSEVLSGRLKADRSMITLLDQLDTPLLPHLDKEYYLASIGSVFNSGSIPSERIKALHRMQTVHLIRICSRNADPETPIAEINTELSLLAEAVIEACLETAFGELAAQQKIERYPHSLVILGLGKLGGCELNVSSDIDLIYLCRESNEYWDHYNSIEFHTLLAERLTRLLTEATGLGALYRVDTRLKADGASGPLVRSTADYFMYLEMRGEAWERQMLLKARPVAGDKKLGHEFLQSIEHFIYPTSLIRSPHREIVEIKNRIEARLSAEGSKKTHLKLAPGGIRDIEFIVQCLELLMGGIHPEVRITGTLPALDKLLELNAINTHEHSVLSRAYKLFRKVENALQWPELLPAFDLPDTAEDMSELAAYLNFSPQNSDSASALSEELKSNLTSVRVVFNDVFSAGDSGSFDQMALHTAIHPTGDENIKRFMENLGFHNPEESARNLSHLVFGKNGIAHESVVPASVERFIPKLLDALKDLPDPAVVLERFMRVAESYKARYTLLDVLDSNPRIFKLLLAITHGSLFITDILERDPSLLDWLVEVGSILLPVDKNELQSELSDIDRKHHADDSYTRACLAVKNREKLRIGSRDISGLTTTAETFTELTIIAECIVNSAYERAFKKFSSKNTTATDYAFGIVAAGRVGAEMMDFGSDLDLIFVYKGKTSAKSGIEAQEFSIKLAQYILSLITGGGGPGQVYEVDARLRPEGGNAVLAISLDEYKRYLKRRASGWERLAMVRSRPIAGNSAFGTEIMEVLENFVYKGPFTRKEIQKIMDIRASMTKSSLKRYPGQINVKSGPGGLADIDFTAQTYAAHYGLKTPSVRNRNTPDILMALGSAEIINRHDINTLTELYTFLCDVEKSLRIGSGRSINSLPASEAELGRISRLLGIMNIRRFKKRLADVTSLAHELYHKLMKELLDQAGEKRSHK
ncbi:hypothetical protein ACFL1R_01715 [Candidatus Latescibacterota bacterium]